MFRVWGPSKEGTKRWDDDDGAQERVHGGSMWRQNKQTHLAVGDCWRYQEPAPGLHPRPKGQVFVLWSMAFAELYDQPTVHVQLLGNSCRCFVLFALCS